MAGRSCAGAGAWGGGGGGRGGGAAGAEAPPGRPRPAPLPEPERPTLRCRVAATPRLSTLLASWMQAVLEAQGPERDATLAHQQLRRPAQGEREAVPAPLQGLLGGPARPFGGGVVFPQS